MTDETSAKADAKRAALVAEWNRVPSSAELARMMDQATKPAVLLNKTAQAIDPGAPGCWLGGEPTLPPEIPWPWLTLDGEPLVPLHFAAQVNLAEVPELDEGPQLPRSGTLFFFFAPALTDVIGWTDGSARVIYTPEDVTTNASRRMPPFPEFSNFPDLENWEEVYAEVPLTGFRKWPFDFLVFETYETQHFPNAVFQQTANEAIVDVFDWLEDVTRDRVKRHGPDAYQYPHHLLGTRGQGAPQPDMIRLLALHGDFDVGWSLGESGWMAFWIDHQDFQARDFSTAFARSEN